MRRIKLSFLGFQCIFVYEIDTHAIVEPEAKIFKFGVCLLKLFLHVFHLDIEFITLRGYLVKHLSGIFKFVIFRLHVCGHGSHVVFGILDTFQAVIFLIKCSLVILFERFKRRLCLIQRVTPFFGTLVSLTHRIFGLGHRRLQTLKLSPLRLHLLLQDIQFPLGFVPITDSHIERIFKFSQRILCLI